MLNHQTALDHFLSERDSKKEKHTGINTGTPEEQGKIEFWRQQRTATSYSASSLTSFGIEREKVDRSRRRKSSRIDISVSQTLLISVPMMNGAIVGQSVSQKRKQ